MREGQTPMTAAPITVSVAVPGIGDMSQPVWQIVYGLAGAVFLTMIYFLIQWFRRCRAKSALKKLREDEERQAFYDAQARAETAERESGFVPTEAI